MSRRFKYALEPVRLQRTWTRSDLQTRLAEHNAKLAQHALLMLELDGQAETAMQGWRALAAPARTLHPEALSAYSAYLGQVDGRIEQARTKRVELEREREQVVALLAQAMRELDAVERHKAERRLDFRMEQGKNEGAEADDQWSILKNRSTHVGQA